MEPVTGRVVQILIAADAGAPMAAVDDARAVPGKGLAGDRYGRDAGTFSPKVHKPDYEVTLIEQENVAAFAQVADVPFSARDARRNIVTTGVRLNDLVGHEFSVGAVRLRGIRLCEPCKYLARKIQLPILPALNGKAGLRAQILNEGVIHVGDAVDVE